LLAEVDDMPERQRAALRSANYIQCNLTCKNALDRCFLREDGKPWDWVINVESEWKLGQCKEAYKHYIYDLSMECAKRAAACGCGVFVQLSTALVYDDNGKPAHEKSSIKPSLHWAQAHARTDKDLALIPNLSLVILRPSIVYGPGDSLFVAHLLVCGRIYHELHEVMREIHRADRRVNTVHVRDVARACIHAARWYQTNRLSASGERVRVFNVSDSGATTLRQLNTIVAEMFEIEVKHHWWTVTKSFIMPKKLILAALDEANEKHLIPWTRLLDRAGIQHTPLTPYLDPEYFYGYEVVVDGTAFTKATGFEYEVPKVTRQRLETAVTEYEEIGLWPRKNVHLSDC